MTQGIPLASTTLIFVPGAWHSPACYDAVIEQLNSHTNSGTRNPPLVYNVTKVPLPSICCATTSASMTSWQPDIDAVVQALEAEFDNSNVGDCDGKGGDIRNVLVISHSYGSLVANEALGLILSSHPDVTSKLKLQHLILCGFIVDVGGAIRQKASTDPYPGLWDVKGDIVSPCANAAAWFYQDLPETEQQKAMKDLAGKYMPLVCFTSPVRFAAWKHVPTTYLYCADDQTVPVAKQEGMIHHAKQAGGIIQTEKVVSGHSPFLAVPGETAQLIRRLTT